MWAIKSKSILIRSCFDATCAAKPTIVFNGFFTCLRNRLVFWFDDKKLLSWMDTISWNFLKKIKKVFNEFEQIEVKDLNK